jgi:hypothetical protein
MPPVVAQSPTETSTSHISRKRRSTCTFSALAQPPSIRPTAQRWVKSLWSLIGDLSNSTISASARMRSSMSSSDMWQPKQPHSEVVATRGLLIASPRRVPAPG